MSELTFVKQTVDSIDMYVSTDGSVSALSGRGLALLCGVDVRVIQKLVNNLVDIPGTSGIPEELKHLRGKAVVVGTYTHKGSNQYESKLLLSTAAARIVEYYAFESKAKNAVALWAFRRFATLGIDKWIKQSTGFVQPISKELSLSTVKEMYETVGHYLLDAQIITERVPGIGIVLSAFKEEQELKLPDPFILREYFEAKGIKDKTTRQKFAHYLSGYYRGTTQLKPKKTYYHNQTKIAGTNSYALEMLPLIEAAWEAFSL